MIGGQLASVQTARMAVPHLRPVIALALARRAVVGRQEAVAPSPQRPFTNPAMGL
jgi:hypothetical protein